MIKAIFFDIDGTLLYGNKGIPEKEVEDLKKLKELGIKIVVCTGRAISEVKPLHLERYNFDAYITLNGQTIFDGNYNLISEHLFDQEDLNKLVKVFDEKRFVVGLNGEDGLYLNYIDDKVKKEHEELNIELPCIAKYHNEKIYGALAYCDEETKQYLRQELSNSIVTFWNSFGVDIFAKSGGKDNGIREYIKIHNISIEETMAFGDSENDIEMIKAVNVGVAMGNGIDALKKEADFITLDLFEDGIDVALKKYEIL